MHRLTFNCPRTGDAIDAGIETDNRTLAAVRTVRVPVYCPHCRTTHELPIECARLGKAARLPEGEFDAADSPKPPMLTIAVNEFRIASLRRGLQHKPFPHRPN
jgi:hypothetical protein